MLTGVINFDMPPTVAAYVHRIGRTARASAAGLALSFVTIKDEPFMARLVKKRAGKLLLTLSGEQGSQTLRIQNGRYRGLPLPR